MGAYTLEQGTVNSAFDNKSEKNDKKNEKKTSNAEEDPEENTGRDQWDNPVEFLLSCVAMSVGLGNVWRFPFTAYENGGGAFLIPYFIILVFVGKPLYYMELVMGQFASYGCVKVWEIVPAFRGIGYGQAVATWCVVTYYVSLMALTIFYFIISFQAIIFQTVLPWSQCPGEVSHCIDASTNLSTLDVNLNETISAAETYFEKEVLQLHPNGLDDGIFSPEWRLSLCLLGSWILLFLILVRGVKSSGKAAYFTALFPYVVLFILLGRGASLPGAYNGIMFFITPKWEKLLEPQVWYAAVSQSFFSLNVGFGTIVMFSSFNKFRHNVYRDALIISVTDTLTSLLAGFTIFAILGHLAYTMGIEDIEMVLKGGGTSLAFVSYPDVLARFHLVPQLFAMLFFIMLFTLGIGSASALAGCIVTIICDEFPKLRRSLVTLFVCCLGFLMGLFYVTPQGQFILTVVDHYGGTFIVYILAFIEVCAVQWIYGYKNFTRDIEFMLGRSTGIFWAFCWTFFIPVLLFVIFTYSLVAQEPLKSGDYVFGLGANGFGYFIIAIAMSGIPICFIYALAKFRRNGSPWIEAFKKCFTASAKWSPKDPVLRKQYYEFLRDHESTQLNGIDNLGASVHEIPGERNTSSKYPALSNYRSTNSEY